MMVPTQEAPSAPAQVRPPEPFTLALSNFEGPFDLLLTLISRRKLDITDIALARVTDEFLNYIHSAFESGSDAALNTASEFLVTAATLLELKTARLLPQPERVLAASPELLEARDLLFARLLQYRAYREVAAVLDEKFSGEAQRFARTVTLEPKFSKVLPELVFDLTPEEFARIAAGALRLDKGQEQEPLPETVQTDHIYRPATTIAAEEALILERLGQAGGAISFTDLCRDTASVEIVVVRFLAVLELYKEGMLQVEQTETLGPIYLELQPENDSAENHGTENESTENDGTENDSTELAVTECGSQTADGKELDRG